MTKLDLSTYHLRATLLAGKTSPRCTRPAPEDIAAFTQGAAYGLSHGLNFAWEMMRAAQDIAALTAAHDVQLFLALALQEAHLDGFPLEPILFRDTAGTIEPGESELGGDGPESDD